MSRKVQIVAAAMTALGIAGAAVSPAEAQSNEMLTCTSAGAVSLAPMSAGTVVLGAYTGVAYYTAEDAGYQVVATLAPGEGGAPIRFVSTLADRQYVVLSVPQKVGMPALEVEFHRCGDAVLVRGPVSLPPAVAVVE